MRRTFLAIVFLAVLHVSSSAQVLFSVGNSSITTQEFLSSYQKNKGSSPITIQEYLELYIRFKLKVKEALALRMDTLPNQINDLLAYIEQIKPQFILNAAAIKPILDEAVLRYSTEIEAGHILIAPEKYPDFKERLDRRMSFESLAIGFSNDPDALQNKGYLGFLSLFTIPYPFENAIYALKDGEVSAPVKSQQGLHIFKRYSSRPRKEKIIVSHILISEPEGATETEMELRKQLADSIYRLAVGGQSFDSLAIQFSEDKTSSSAGGIIPDMELGDYDPLFEKQIVALQRDNDISPVFRTAYGFHLLKRIRSIPVEKDPEQIKGLIGERLMQDDRTAGLCDLPITDPAFDAQLNEFKEGNLLFDIMDKNIWSVANTDDEQLKSFHAARKERYTWQQSVDALIVTCETANIANMVRDEYLKDRTISSIRKYFSEIAFIDSSRYEAGELLGVGKENATEGFVAPVYHNESDGSSTFVIVLKVHADPSPKTFEQAKVAVISDYQDQLEDKWIASLKKKHPVVVLERELKKLLETTR
ncbi:MAG: hypothetical protein FJX83_04330 [Bacteroidetes bacterium]|nr:hypothetical protein [Bacteroidota bacterium]